MASLALEQFQTASPCGSVTGIRTLLEGDGDPAEKFFTPELAAKRHMPIGRVARPAYNIDVLSKGFFPRK